MIYDKYITYEQHSLSLFFPVFGLFKSIWELFEFINKLLCSFDGSRIASAKYSNNSSIPEPFLAEVSL